MKHTPGPWKLKKWNIYGADGYGVTSIPDASPSEGGNPPVDKANAKLIAAAPQMLEALIAFLTDQDECISGRTSRLCLAAVRKAGGEL